MKQPEWQFASTGGGIEDGVSNPEVEYFEGDYNYFLAREILQNALDARLDTSKPVKVVFNLVEFNKNEFPGYDQFYDIWNKAKKHWPEEEIKCHSFLDKGLNCLNAEKINVLKISDYNTIGLNGGDNDKSNSWFGLVKSVGSSNKNEGQGGSFGIGKGAPFAASYLRTCFYSTKNELAQNVVQGISKIVSFSEDDDVKRGYGSFGLKNQSAIRDRRLLDEHLARKERGLDIFILGYKLEDNWELKLIESVLRNFWPAIYHEELIVDIDGSILSNKTLEDKLTKYFINKPTKDTTKPEGNPLEYFRAYKNKDKLFQEELKELGNVKFYFRGTDENLNRVAMIRKSKMVIYTRAFHHPANYAGVFICDNEEGNSKLRKMEPPEHDKWDQNRFKEKGNEIEHEIRNFIRGNLKSLTRIKESQIMEVPGLHKYLPFDEDGIIPGEKGKGGEYTGNESDIESGREIGITEEFDEDIIVTPYKIAVINNKTKGAGGAGVVKAKTKKKIKKGKKRRGSGEGSLDALLDKSLETRIFLKSQENESLNYKVLIKSKISGKFNIKLFAVGEEGMDKVNIIKAFDDSGNKLVSSGHRIMKVPLELDENTFLNVQIHGNIKLSLKLEGYGLQQ